MPIEFLGQFDNGCFTSRTDVHVKYFDIPFEPLESFGRRVTKALDLSRAQGHQAGDISFLPSSCAINAITATSAGGSRKRKVSATDVTEECLQKPSLKKVKRE